MIVVLVFLCFLCLCVLATLLLTGAGSLGNSVANMCCCIVV